MTMKHQPLRLTAIALTAVAAALVTLHAATAQTTAAPPGDATHGKAAFLSYGCYECHGTAGNGNYGAGPKLAPHPLPWQAVVNQVRRPRQDMPSYSATILPDKDLADIYAYLESIPAGKAGSQIPLLSNTTMKPK
jgi:mono/diheme cytochrome c family protein